MPNTILKRWNGTAFEELYPKTTVGQIAASGTADSTTFLRGDGQWATPSDVDTNNYLTGVSGSGNGTVTFTRQGLSNLTWDASHNHSIGYYSSALSTNLDTLYGTGQFGFLNTTTGRPEDYGQGINIVNSGTAHNNTNNWITQLAFGTSTTTSYFRSKTNTGAWSAWRKIWNDANDGSGSGLDADLLDGNHASAFALDNAVVKLTGDQTIAGTKTFSATIVGNQGINLNNSNIININNLTIGDPGPDEGINWAGGNLWKIYESPNDLTTNGAGNLQIVQNATRRATFNTSGQLELPVATGTAPLVITSTTVNTNLNADMVDGLHSTSLSKRVNLTGQVQTTSYRKSVIALCELTNTNPSANSYSIGMITFHRTNGLTAPVLMQIAMEKRYNVVGGNYTSFVQAGDSFGDNVQYIKFQYNGIWYGGIEFFFSDAELSEVTFHGESNFAIFGIDYYNTQTSTVINSEVNGSITTADMAAENDLFLNNNKVWTAQNDGSGSGLDADLLDGNHASAFVLKSGDTMTGDLTISSTYPRINLTDTNHNSDYSIINNDGSLGFWDNTNSAYRMHILSSGNVGIGTTAPAAQFEIKSNDINKAPIITDTQSGHNTNLQEWKVDTGIIARLAVNGNFRTNVGIANLTSDANANISVGSAGTVISRNIADTNPALIVNKVQGTGNILQIQSASANKLEVDVNGWLYQNGTRLFTQIGAVTNTFFGQLSGNALTTGGINTGFGYGSLNNVTSGAENTAIGVNSGLSINTATRSTFLGRNAGNNASQLATGTNMTAIGFESYTDKSNQMVFGNASVTEFKFDRNASAVLLAPRVENVSTTTNILTLSTSSVDTMTENLRVYTNSTGGSISDGLGSSITFGISLGSLFPTTLGTIGVARSGSGSGRLRFLTNNAGSTTEKMTILPDGNVGIGTTSPSEKLEVSGNAKATTFISTVALGTAPLTVTSSTKVNNLNADFLDGYDATSFMLASGMSSYAPLASPALTGTPTAPTATAGTNTTQIATTAFVSTAVANLINSAPGALDTLDELAAALGDDANFASTVTNSLALKAPLASPALTGTPTAPTAAGGTNTTQIATTQFVTSAVTGNINLGSNSITATRLKITADGTQPNWEIFESSNKLSVQAIDGSTNPIYDIWHSGNDGASSGLDADLLDGQQGTYYQAASTALTTSTSFGGDVSGTYNAIVVADDSHDHIISNVDGLQTALDSKAADADVVKLTGTQSVGGVKTFTSIPVFDAGITIANSSSTISDSITFNTAQAYTGPYLRGSAQVLQRGYYTAQYQIWDAESVPNPTSGTGTANQIAYYTGAQTLGSLSTATYPSLTELSYVKGVTSAIQTQLNREITKYRATQQSSTTGNTNTTAVTSITLLANKYYHLDVTGMYSKTSTSGSTAPVITIAVDNTTGTPTINGRFEWLNGSAATAYTVSNTNGAITTSTTARGFTAATATLSAITTTPWGLKALFYTGTSDKVLTFYIAHSSSVSGTVAVDNISIHATEVLA